MSYNASTGVLEAHGNVVMQGNVVMENKEAKYNPKTKYGDWMTFRVKDGTVELTGCICGTGPKRDSRGQLLNSRHPRPQ
jgi:hypothetical protein